MKRNFKIFAIMAATLGIITSCNDANVDDTDGDKDKNKPKTMTVTAAEAPIMWSKNDIITLFSEKDNSAYDFTSTLTEESAETSSFTGLKLTNDGGAYWAIYPKADDNKADYTTQELTFATAATQAYDADAEVKVLPIISKGSDIAAMTFSAPLATIEVSLNGVGTVKNIIISSSNESEMLYGDVKVDMSQETPAISRVENGGAKLTLNCGEGVVLDESTATTFTILAPSTAAESSTKISIILDDQTVNYVDERNIEGNTTTTVHYEIKAPLPPLKESAPYTLADISNYEAWESYPTDDVWEIKVDGGDMSILSGDLQSVMTRAYGATNELIDITLTTDDGATTLSESSFKDCTTLGALDISDFAAVPTLFANGSSITSVKLSRNTLSIGSQAFKSCASLASVTYDTESRTAQDGMVVGAEAFLGCVALTSLDLSDGVELGNYVASGCTLLTTIDLSSATSIGDEILNSCNALTDIDFSATGDFTFTTTADGSKVFFGVYARMASVTLALNDDKCLGGDVTPQANVENKTWLSNANTSAALPFANIEYPSKPEEPIKISEFKADGSYIPEGTEWNIAVDNQGAIANLAATLKSIDYQVNITFNHSGAVEFATGGPFKGVTTINKVTFRGFTEITHGVLRETTIKEVDFGEVTSIGNEIFAVCKNIDKIIGNSITSIGSSVFNGADCSTITEMQFGAEGEITFVSGNFAGLPFANCALYIHGSKVESVVSNTFLGNAQWISINDIAALAQ